MEEKQVAKLDHVENMGIYLMAHGTVDGVAVQAPFIEMTHRFPWSYRWSGYEYRNRNQNELGGECGSPI